MSLFHKIYFYCIYYYYYYYYYYDIVWYQKRMHNQKMFYNMKVINVIWTVGEMNPRKQVGGFATFIKRNIIHGIQLVDKSVKDMF